MLGTFVNCATVILGTLIGLLFAKKNSTQLQEIILIPAGVVTLVVGFSMAFESQNIIYLMVALVLGGLLGTWLDIDGKILLLGRFLEKYFGGSTQSHEKGNSRFAYAFLNASVLFCVGAMAIVGSFKAGTANDYTILLTKSTLDGFMAIVFASSMGIGTAFSALSILVYQGSLTLLSRIIAPWVSEYMIIELNGIGGALIVMIGINLLSLKTIKTANYLPSMLFTVLLVLINPFIIKVAENFSIFL